MKTLITWIGHNDLEASQNRALQGLGPIGDFLSVENYDHVLLLNNWGLRSARFSHWLEQHTGIPSSLLDINLTRPHDFDTVYDTTRDSILHAVLGDNDTNTEEISYLLSSGTKAMSSALLLIGCSDISGKIYFNWIDKNEEDPNKRYVRIKWPERFSLALFATRKQTALSTEPLIDFEGRELSDHPSMKRVYEKARRIAVTNYPVLIHGETGTGKEILADYIIQLSARGIGPRINVNCGAIPETLIDSELFGYKKGAFTGANKDTPGKILMADGGTIFLDEIGELPLAAQVRLLRFLQEGEITPVGAVIPTRVDVRVVVASHRDLRELVRNGRFREDLYFRIARYPLFLPPLRSRGTDLRLIGNGILQNDANARGVTTKIDEGAWQVLSSYSWPGNIRELQNILIRSAIDALETPHGRIISAELVQQVIFEQGLEGPSKNSIENDGGETPELGGTIVKMVRESGMPLQDILERLEAMAIQEAIRQEPRQKDAGKLLGYSPQNLSNTKRRLKEKGFWVDHPN